MVKMSIAKRLAFGMMCMPVVLGTLEACLAFSDAPIEFWWLAGAAPILLALAAPIALRIAGLPARRGSIAVTAGVAYGLLLMPWSAVVFMLGGAVGPCGGSGVQVGHMFVWLMVPSLCAGVAIGIMTRSWIVGSSAPFAAAAATAAWHFLDGRFGEDESMFFIAHVWIEVVLVALFAWAFATARAAASTVMGCLVCGYDLSGNVTGVCPECGAVTG